MFGNMSFVVLFVLPSLFTDQMIPRRIYLCWTFTLIFTVLSSSEVKSVDKDNNYLTNEDISANASLGNLGNDTDIDLRSSDVLVNVILNEDKSQKRKKKKNYYVVYAKKSWGAAMSYCKRNGHVLAAPRNNEENKALLKMIDRLERNIEHVWIGGQCFGTRFCEWVNPTQKIKDFSHFHKDEPCGRGKNCINYRRQKPSSTWAWDDQKCKLYKHPFICEIS